jgi:hypothetical protein
VDLSAVLSALGFKIDASMLATLQAALQSKHSAPCDAQVAVAALPPAMSPPALATLPAPAPPAALCAPATGMATIPPSAVVAVATLSAPAAAAPSPVLADAAAASAATTPKLASTAKHFAEEVPMPNANVVRALSDATALAQRQSTTGSDWKDNAGNEVAVRKNSCSNPNEWAQFTRAMISKGKHHANLVPWYRDDKSDLFNTWLVNNKDMSRCTMVLTRRQTRKQTSKGIYGWRKVRDIAKDAYGGDMDKAKLAALKRKEKGQWMKDDDFPDDDAENYYWWRIDRTLEVEHSTEEVNEVKVESELDAEHAQEFGTLLSLPPVAAGMAPAASANFWGEMEGLNATSIEEKKGKDKKHKDDEAKAVEPDSPLKIAEKLGDKLLKYSSTAHKFHVGLCGVDVSDNMAVWMKTAETTAQDLFKILQNKTRAKLDTEEDYEEITASSTVLFDVFDQYQPLANQMLQRLKGKKQTKKEGDLETPPAKKVRRSSAQ